MGTTTSSRAHREARRRRAARARREQLTRERAYGLPPVSGTTPAPQAERALGRVRALLAKAESTTFAEEAEALSAKAQELISRYSLERLLDEAQGGVEGDVTTREIHLVAPYVMPKALLVSAVAAANRCECIVRHEVAVVIGAPADLDAVELLARSLLLQAEGALVVAGRHVEAGRSRTASFRRAFLIAYGHRIAERLRAADRTATEHLAPGGSLLPVLARHDERVSAAREALFPHTRTVRTTVSNRHGWAAGRAAADLARLAGSAELDPGMGRT